jgi:hypothetical protein
MVPRFFLFISVGWPDLTEPSFKDKTSNNLPFQKRSKCGLAFMTHESEETRRGQKLARAQLRCSVGLPNGIRKKNSEKMQVWNF